MKAKPTFSNTKGFSLMEAMIAGVLVGIIAIGIMPAVWRLLDTSRISGFKSVCNTYVKGKMQEYMNGVAQEYNGSGSAVALSFIPSGFDYTKRRYQLTGYSSCSTATQGAPGFREAINSNNVLANAAAQETITVNSQTQFVPNRLQGFQLWVLMKRYNPRILTGTGSQATRDCPPATEQFFRLGDAIEVTVTGMIRVRPAVSSGGRGGELFGGIDDIDSNTPNRLLTCSMTQIIYPPRAPFRYYLGLDGKMRNYQASLSFLSNAPDSSQEALEAHFRGIWSLAPTGGTINSNAVANIRSFAVSPDNSRVWVLKPGELWLYRNCTDQAVTVGANAYTGIPNCTPTTTANCAAGNSNDCKYTVDENISSIAVNFVTMSPTAGTTADTTASWANDQISTLYNAAGISSSVTPINRLNLKPSGTLAVSGATLAYDTTVTNPYSVVSNPRIKGIYIMQSFGQSTTPTARLFFLDNSCYIPTAFTLTSSNFGQWTQCVNAYSADDITLQMVSRELPIQVQAVSN